MTGDGLDDLYLPSTQAVVVSTARSSFAPAVSITGFGGGHAGAPDTGAPPVVDVDGNGTADVVAAGFQSMITLINPTGYKSW